MGAIQGASAVSLYQEGSYQSLASDRKAHQRGDLLTVLVFENASASSTANTVASRDARVGLDVQLNAGVLHGGGLKTGNELDGRGSTVRAGKVLAQLTVKVKDVTDNGDMLIGGEQFLEINDERQQIRIEGRVRPQDVSDANTVLSTRIADAKITYSGEGDLADHQRPAWWHRLLTWFGL
jgi:flagellar L-ring protein precursor FlgH